MNRREFLTATGAAGFMLAHVPGHGLAQGTMAPPAARGAPAANPFLTAGFAPVHDELVVDSLSIGGSVPREIFGIYMRNGPNPAYAPLSYTYPFDGDGMIHALYFDGGRVSYRNRFVMTRGLKTERRAGRAIYGGLMRPVQPDPALVGSDGDPSPFKNLSNTNVIQHGGKYLSLWEGGLPYELNRELETIGDYDFAGKVRDAMTAHPKFDPASGEMLMFHYALTPPYLIYRAVDRSGVVVRERPIDAGASFMIHDFAVTATYVIFVLAPAIFDLAAAKKGGPLLSWQPQRGTRVAVIRRDGEGETKWMDTDAFFLFHFMNAYESGDKIIVDYVQHEAFGRGPKGLPASLWRLTLDMKEGRAARTQIDDRPAEFPRVDPRRVGLAHRYGWLPVAGTGERAPGTYNAIARYDLETGNVAVHDFGPGREVDEPVIIPRPGSQDDGDGWLMTYLYDRRSDSSVCVILDPKDIARAPIAEIVMPRRIPHGLHGNWMPA
jgi:carotenoid cleavage dioxygenase-like enzyme